MFERFTNAARKSIALANQEAQRFNHEYIGTEHILLGVIKEGEGAGATVLKNFGIDIKKLRLEIEKLIKSGPDMVKMGKLPQTPLARKTIEYTIEEAQTLGHKWIGTGHILLGLLRETEGIHSQVLTSLGLDFENVRAKVLAELKKFDWTKNEVVIENEELLQHEEKWVNFAPLTLLIDHGDATAQELSELFVELSTLYHMVGGSGVDFTIIDAKEPAVA